MILAFLEPMSWSLEEGAIKTIEVGLEELAQGMRFGLKDILVQVLRSGYRSSLCHIF